VVEHLPSKCEAKKKKRKKEKENFISVIIIFNFKLFFLFSEFSIVLCFRCVGEIP
jgi:hypothetical protein